MINEKEEKLDDLKDSLAESIEQIADIVRYPLFSEYKLYSEGRHKTWFRGVFHTICCLTLFPYFIWKYYNHVTSIHNANLNCDLSQQPPNNFALIVCFFNLIVLYIAHLFSAIYHAFPLTIDQEIVLQKLDIATVSWYIGTSYFPMALLLFPTNVGISLAIIVTLLAIWNCYDVWRCKYPIHRPIYFVAMQIPFAYYICTYLTSQEVIYNYSAIASFFVGAVFFIYEVSPSWFNTDIFDHFEIYHSMSVICLTLTIMMNYSIFERTYSTSTFGKGGAKS